MRTRRLSTAQHHDDGLSLIEVMVALLMLSIVSISAAVVFVGSLRTTTEQSAKQRAIAVATRALENVQSVPVSQVLVGRQQTAVQALNSYASVAPLVAQDITAADNFDASADGSSVPVVPLQSIETLEGVRYQVRTAINRCWLSRARKTCEPTAGTDGVQVLRATVNVTWGDAACRRCSYAVSALLDRQGEPIFRLAQSRPLIQRVTPGSVEAGSSQSVIVDGAAFELGARVEITAGGGSFTGLTRVDSNTLRVTWTAGATPGTYGFAVTNPDDGRAEYALTITTPTPPVTPPPPAPVTPPRANDDCVATTRTAGDILIDVRANDVPAGTGSVRQVSNPGTGSSTVVSDRIAYTPSQAGNGNGNADRGVGVFTLTYEITTANGTSNRATVTVRVESGPC